MNTPVREGETIEGSRTMRNRPYPVLKCSKEGWQIVGYSPGAARHAFLLARGSCMSNSNTYDHVIPGLPSVSLTPSLQTKCTLSFNVEIYFCSVTHS